MKLALLSCSLIVVAAFAAGCSADEEQAPPPPEPVAMRNASKLERRLSAPILIPSDSPIGKTIDSVVEARLGGAPAASPAAPPAEGEDGAEPAPAEPSPSGLTARPAGTIGATGKKCTVVRYDDEKGVEQMRRTKCEKTDEVKVGKITYSDENGDGKIDALLDLTSARYEAYDDDRDGKVDRVVEFETRIAAPPPALSDFGEDVTIVDNGKIESRAREDRDHDGKFDFEALTATTAFRLRTR